MNEIYKKVITHYGEVARKEKASEELRELDKEIWDELQHGDYDKNKMLSEIADVLNMILQLQIMFEFSLKDIKDEMCRKMERTLIEIDQENTKE